MKNFKLLLGLFAISCLILIGCKTTGKENPKENGSADKFALVIGNSNYQYAPKLRNPKNDAEDVANVLTQFGFSVELCFDLNYEQMVKMIDKYVGNLSSKNDAEGVFYYAGSGFKVNDNNYLMPIDFNEKNTNNIISEAYTMAALFTKLIEAGNAPNVVIVDSCFSEMQMAQQAHRGIVFVYDSDGLELIEKFTKDIFYLQSAMPGKIALDGGISDRNSPFTKALLKNIVKPVKFTELVQDIIADTVLY